ncbi:ABC transporter ATP-binding protein [Lagierella sp.]|uniref:ABC transporter ATP-binding protein n=1 Tax=Lagierella sp. TaxID=2849657 RepID=UPI00260CACED|nr:ABC transporter ATP-binding protein [Lagierella sp.]
MININNLKVKYGDFTALDIGKEIVIDKNRKLGVLGSNGAGKTTLINAIMELVPYEGSIKKSLPKEEIAVHMQNNYYPDNIAIRSVMEAVIGTKLEKSEKIMELIKFFNFESALKKNFKELSGGQKQRLTVILVLSQESPITIFDEVTSGLDFQTRTGLMDLLEKWYSDREDTLILVSHYYDELERLVDDVLILERGKLIDYGNKLSLFNKYCGKRVISFDEKDYVEDLMKDFKKIAGPEGKVVISINENEEEERLQRIMIAENIDFERSSKDMETMYINALRKEGIRYEAK